MSAIEEIAAERQRQIDDEGWDHEHDDEHTAGNLALAGACYASAASAGLSTPGADYKILPASFRWPWEAKWWKLKNPRRDLIRAAALIVAEIERMDRKDFQRAKP